MKALSLKQPFAELILQRRKKIELRKWNTKFKGQFYIHSSKVPDAKAMKKFGFEIGSLPTGAIVGKANLVDVKEYKTSSEHKEDKRLHLVSTAWGRYGFILSNVQRVRLIPCKGSLNFWTFKN